MATSDISKSPLYIDSTNSRVGVGTASPSEVLEVYGTTPIIQINDRGLYQAQIGLIGNDTEFRGSSGNIEFYTGSADGASSTERMRIDTSGNVGIGTSNITSPFVVNTSFNSGYLSQFVNTGTGSDPNGVLIQAGVVDSAYVLRLQKQNASDVLVVRGSGNVGIGITSPSELLHIKNASGDAAVRVQGNTRTFNIQQNNYGLRFVDVDAGSAERMRIDAAGNVTMPYQPAFRAINAPVTSTNGVLYWANAPINVGGHYNASNGRFTAPTAGNYLFTMSMLFPTTNTSYARILFAVNGVPSTLYADTLTSAGASYLTLSSSAIIGLSAGDYVTVVNDGQIATYGVGYGSFCGHLIG
jgi:hypothetical protein